MKIGLITIAMDDMKAGIGWYCHNLINNIIKIDHDNEYVLIHRQKSDDPLYRMCEELIIPYPKIPMKRTISNNVQLPLKLRNCNFDVIHELSQLPIFWTEVNSKKIITIHDLSPLLYPEVFDVFTVYLSRYLLPHALKKADIVIAVSNNTKKDLIRIFKFPEKRINVIYLGVDEIFKPTKVSENFLKKYKISKPYILYVGTLEPRKNISTLLKAFYKLKKRYNIPHTLVIAGKIGWKYRGIFKTLEKLKLQKYTTFTGYIPREDLPKLYSSADVFVYPSIYEGFGLPPLEAMACGCPVITTNVSSLPEVVGNAGIKINPYDIAELATAIYQTIVDENLRKILYTKGINRAKKFSWKNTAKKTLKIYREI